MSATLVTDYLFEAKPRWSGTIGAGGVAAAGTTTIPLSSAAELDNGDAYVFVVNRVTPAGAKNDLSDMETVIGELSGTNFINCVRGVEGTAQAYDAGTVVEILFTATHWNKLIEAWETEHNQDGTHSVAKMITEGTVSNDPTLADASETELVTEYAAKAYVDADRNLIINSGFTVNQRGYVSNAVLAAGAYGHDRWKAGASGGDYTFTQLNAPTQITIKSGKSLIQVVENINVEGGDYTLSWEGTAQARFGKDSATPSGSYAASPITVTGQAAGTVMSVEFNEGTLGKVVLTKGTNPAQYYYRRFDEELRACQRYAIKINEGMHFPVTVMNANTCRFPIPSIENMRTSPSMVDPSTGGGITEGSGNNLVISSSGDASQSGFSFFIAGNIIRADKAGHGLTVPQAFLKIGSKGVLFSAEL